MKPRLISILALGLSFAANAAVFDYSMTLDGPSEPTPSLGTGFGTASYDDTLHTLQIQLSFSGLQGNTSAAHIHAPTLVPLTGTANVATTTPSFVGFPLGVTSGTFNTTLDLTQASSYNASFITANGGTTAGAESALAAAIAGGNAYFNIHSTSFGGGEIRGFLVPVPEPSTLAFAGLGLIGAILGFARRRPAS
jgi:hypothetical protein